MPAPLTKPQKRYLSQLARRAWQAAGPELDGESETDYRHWQVALATGKAGLRCCSQDDYGAVKGHFLNLLGETTRAFQAIHHGEGNQRRVAQWKVVQACREAGVEMAYAAKICANMFKCPLEDASTDQLWKLMFTLKNRGRKVTFREDARA
jgi:hypothetical protein